MSPQLWIVFNIANRKLFHEFHITLAFVLNLDSMDRSDVDLVFLLNIFDRKLLFLGFVEGPAGEVSMLSSKVAVWNSLIALWKTNIWN